jgi:S1-C subfamily serine protease
MRADGWFKRRARRAAVVLLVALTGCGAIASSGTLGATATPTAATTTDATVASSTGSAKSIVQVVEELTPSVVTVTSTLGFDPFGGGQGKAVGTGFVVRQDGIILTNQHVVAGASSVSVALPSGSVMAARVVASDTDHDLAVLKVDATGLPAVALGDSGALQVGETVVAIGYALDLGGGPTVTSGIVSSLARSIDVQDGNGVRTYHGVLQTDAALNPGNSGGPLVTLDGRVVGVDVAGGTNSENIGFAVPVNAARSLLADAIAQLGALG